MTPRKLFLVQFVKWSLTLAPHPLTSPFPAFPPYFVPSLLLLPRFPIRCASRLRMTLKDSSVARCAMIPWSHSMGEIPGSWHGHWFLKSFQHLVRHEQYEMYSFIFVYELMFNWKEIVVCLLHLVLNSSCLCTLLSMRVSTTNDHSLGSFFKFCLLLLLPLLLRFFHPLVEFF